MRAIHEFKKVTLAEKYIVLDVSFSQCQLFFFFLPKILNRSKFDSLLFTLLPPSAWMGSTIIPATGLPALLLSMIAWRAYCRETRIINKQFKTACSYWYSFKFHDAPITSVKTFQQGKVLFFIMIVRCLSSSAVFYSVSNKPDITKGENSNVYRVRMSN